MTEYIEREAAIDAIMKVYVRTAGYKARERVFEAKEAVHRLPVADVAPVVYCRHCRSYNKPRLGWCSFHMDRENYDDFCSYGERKDGDAAGRLAYGVETRFVYFQKCGARMDGDDNGSNDCVVS